jgi:hypothetical protein
VDHREKDRLKQVRWVYCKYVCRVSHGYHAGCHVSASALMVAVQGSGGFSTSSEAFAGMFQPGKIMLCELL